MIHEFQKLIPVHTPLGDGYVLYVKDNGPYENDELCVVLFNEGAIRHFTTEQVKVWHNATYGIEKQPIMPEVQHEHPF